MSEPLNLDSEIDRLAKVHAEAGFPVDDRYVLGLPVIARFIEGPPELRPIETTIQYTDTHGTLMEQTIQVQHFEVTPFVRSRAELVYGPKGHNVGPGD